MKILIDVLHPQHVHIFRNFMNMMVKRGHTIQVTARQKDVTLPLLRAYKIPFVSLSTISETKLGLAWEWFKRVSKLLSIARRFRPDVLLGVMGPCIAPVGKLLEIPTLVFHDNETATTTNRWVERWATAYITSTSYEAPVKGRHVTHSSYHELSYLHPNYFKPNRKVPKELGIKPDERFFIVRFVSWQSSHDVGAQGIADKVNFVKTLAQHGRVVISSEKQLPPELQQYGVKIAPEKLHDLLAFATLCVGESATLTSEAACLGVPAIYIANTKRGYCNELERKYGLAFNFTSTEQGMRKALELLKQKNLRKEFQKKRQKMLREQIDLTQWMVEFVENMKWLIKTS